MTEEEIIKICKDLISMTDYKFQCNYTIKERNQAIQELVDLYNKQKGYIEDCEEKIVKFQEHIDKQQKEIKELKKYDYRNMKIDDNNKIYSPNFTDTELHFMNFGIAIYESMQNFDKLNDKNDI